MQTVYWLVIFIVLLIIEIITMGLTTIWFALGALAAFLAGVFGFGTAVQVGVFLVVSLVLLALTRPVAVKYFNKDRTKTNAESLIGQHGLVVEDVDTLKSTARSGRQRQMSRTATSGRTPWWSSTGSRV